MSTKLNWDQPSKTDILRQKNKKHGPPNDINPLHSIPPPQLAFDDMNGQNEIITKRKRYIAKIKNVCMAIPFDPNASLLSFQKEVIFRATTHRKLKKESKLSNRIQFIKLATPHFPQLIDCYGHDSLCEIATESDVLIFDTISDDDKNEEEEQQHQQLYNTFKSSNSNSIYVPKPTTKNIKENSNKKSNMKNKKKSSYTPTPQLKTYSNSNSKPMKNKKDEKLRNKSMIIKTTSNSSNQRDKKKRDKKKENKNRRNLSADLDQTKINFNNIQSNNSNESKKNKKNQSKNNTKRSNTNVNTINPMISSKSGPDLQNIPNNNNNNNNNNSDENDSDDSVRSGYSGHSGYGSDEKEKFDNLEVITTKKKKKKKIKNKSNEMDDFRKQIQTAKQTQKKFNNEQDSSNERSNRKNRSFNANNNHGRSISLSGAAMLHSGDTKKKKTKKSKKGTESIYASNVQSKSSKSSRRLNAFEFFAGNKKGSKKKNNNSSNIDQEKRKKKYRYGNRNINVIRPSIIPYVEEQSQLPEYYLDLKYIHGYDGYDLYNRQNLFLSHSGEELIYPMARTGILLNLNNNTQRHWMDAREAISSICIHPTAPIIVTGHFQKGPDRAKIRVWNYKTFILHKLIKKIHDASVLCCQWSRNSGYLYTIGGGEMHKMVLWNGKDLFKLKNGNDHEDIINSDVNSKKKNFINCPPGKDGFDIVSDLLLGKQDILGFEINPYISDQDEKQGILDEFVCFGKKNVKYYEVKFRTERRNGRNCELVMPSGKTLVMGKLGSKSSEYERIYHSCVWLKNTPSWYLLGGHTGTLYICYKQSCLKKLTNFGLTSQIGCMLNIENIVFIACWDGKLTQFNVSNISNLKLKKINQRMIHVPRSGDEETGLKTQSPRTIVYDNQRNLLYLGLRTNQIISLNMSVLYGGKSSNSNSKSDNKLHGTELLLDSHYGYVKCLATHPYEPYYVTGSDDSTLRIWDINGLQCLQRFKFDDKEKPSFLRFSHSGYLLAVGLTTSKIVILAWKDCNLSEVKGVVQMPFKIDKNLKRSQQMDAKNSDFTTDITVIKWSSDDLNFAAGHIDAIAHIFSIKYHNNDPTDEISVFDYNLEIKPWDHSLDVSNGLIDIQWSDDNQWLLTFTKDQDLMVWFLHRSQQTFEHYLYWLDPDKISFTNDPLLAGWDVEGVFQTYVGWDGTDLNSLSLTKQQFKKSSPVHDYDLNQVGGIKQKQQYKCKLLASADNKGYIRIHNYPALKEAAHHYYSGHANQVCSVQWSANDEYLISVGGSDRSVFQWQLTNVVTDYIKKYKPLKSTNSFKK